MIDRTPLTFESNVNRQRNSQVSQIQISNITKPSKIPQKTIGNQKSPKNNDLNSIAINEVPASENTNPPIDNHHNIALVQAQKTVTTDANGVNVRVTVGSSPRGYFISNDTSHLPPPPPFYGVRARNRVNVKVFADPQNN